MYIKMKKYFIFLLFTLLVVCAAAGFAACSQKDDEHVWSEEWSHNADGHWKQCQNKGCNERGEFAPHQNFKLVSTEVAPTCYTYGQGTYECEVCGYTKTDQIPPTEEHDFDSVEWQPGGEGHETQHKKVCAKPGCYATIYEDHAEGTRRLIQAALPFKDGVAQYYCEVCNQVLRTEVEPAVGVPVSFEVNFKKAKKFLDYGPVAGWAADDPEPQIKWLDETTYGNVLKVGEVTLVKDDLDRATYFYEVEIINARNAAGNRISLPDYDEETGGGLKLGVIDPTTGEPSYSGYSSEFIIYMEKLVRFKRESTDTLRFAVVAQNTEGEEEERASVEIRVTTMKYSDWKKLVQSQVTMSAPLPVTVPQPSDLPPRKDEI